MSNNFCSPAKLLVYATPLNPPYQGELLKYYPSGARVISSSFVLMPCKGKISGKISRALDGLACLTGNAVLYPFRGRKAEEKYHRHPPRKRWRSGVISPIATAWSTGIDSRLPGLPGLHFAFEAFEGMYLFILQGEDHAGIGGEILVDNT